MLYDEQRHKVLAKLTNARNEPEDTLNLSIARAGYDTVVLADARRRELSVMVDDLNRQIQQLQSVH